VRFFLRGAHPELMAAYRKDGQFDSIPVLVFLDADFNEIGRYVERPDEVTAMYARHRDELAGRHPEFAPAGAPLRDFDEPVRERLRAALDQLRERDRPEANAAIAVALEALAERAAGGTREVPHSPARATAPNPAEEAAPGRDQPVGQEPDAGEACPIEW
jgi:Thioredoxin